MFDRQEDVFINFNYGYQYDLDNRLIIKIFYPLNHFTSRIEKIKNGVETVIIPVHSVIHTVAPVIEVNNKNKYLWIEVIHNANLSNWLRADKPVFSTEVLKSFHIQGTLSFFIALYQYWRYIKKETRLGARAVIRKVGLSSYAKAVKKSLHI
jgi:hypothetical protein